MLSEKQYGINSTSWPLKTTFNESIKMFLYLLSNEILELIPRVILLNIGAAINVWHTAYPLEKDRVER